MELSESVCVCAYVQVKSREKEMRLLLIGLDNAGKTTVVKRLAGEDIDEVSPTLGFHIKSLSFRGYRLNVWDIGGQRSLRSYWRNYFEQTDGLVWVVDSADRRRLADMLSELRAILGEEKLAGATLLVLANKQDVRGAMSPAEIEREVTRGVPGLRGSGGGSSVSYKTTHGDTRPTNTMPPSIDDASESGDDPVNTPSAPPSSTTNDNGKNSQARGRHWRVGACSAVTGDGLLDNFDWLVGDIGSRIFMFD